MKKELLIVLILVSMILAFVSAFSFSDIWSKITSRVIGPVCECSTCSECTNMLKSASCTEIILIRNISEAAVDCIYFSSTSSMIQYKTIDCQNHKIQRVGSTSGSGISIRNGKSITIKNCVISGFGTGIYFFSNMTGSIIENNKLINNSQQGINIRSSISNQIRNNLVYKSNNYGIWVTYSNTTQILNNKISGSLNIGLSVSSGRNILRDNEICGSKYKDLSIPANSDNKVSNTTCMASTPDGLCSNPCEDIS